jgi:type I restriction enzyme S subunit
MSDLPQGWASGTLDEAALINPRHPPGIDDATAVTFTPMPAISESGPDFQFTITKTFAEARKGFTHYADGDVLFAKITPCMENGKGAVARNLVNGIGFGTTELHVVRPLGGIDPHYLYRFVQQASFRGAAEAAFTGSAGQARVPVDFIRNTEVPLAPLAEQRRIVAKLDALLARVNACQQRLDKIPKFLARFRQSVLASACSGRLTADWRNCHRSTFDPAKTIKHLGISRLAAAKTENQRNTVRECYAQIEEGDNGHLPESWQFTHLAKLAESFDYGTAAKSQPTGKVPVLRMGNIQNGRIDWSDLVYASDKREIERYGLTPGTVIFNRTNSPELVGKTAIYRGERPAIFAGYLIRVNTVGVLSPEYLNICLNGPAAREFCRSVKSDGVSQSNINAKKLGTFEVPFCSPEEQAEIVRRVERLFAFADRLEARVEVARKRVAALTQSILAKAFRGELVPTEAELAAAEGREFESAAELLERIRSESQPLVRKAAARREKPLAHARGSEGIQTSRGGEWAAKEKRFR